MLLSKRLRTFVNLVVQRYLSIAHRDTPSERDAALRESSCRLSARCLYIPIKPSHLSAIIRHHHIRLAICDLIGPPKRFDELSSRSRCIFRSRAKPRALCIIEARYIDRLAVNNMPVGFDTHSKAWAIVGRMQMVCRTRSVGFSMKPHSCKQFNEVSNQNRGSISRVSRSLGQRCPPAHTSSGRTRTVA